MRQRPFSLLATLSLCLFVFGSLIHETLVDAGGPLLVTKRGRPYIWDTSRPVTFTPDQGPLGQLNNAEAVALTNELFKVWEEVTTATIRFQRVGALSTDVTGENVMEFLNTVPDTVNPIIFDNDGSVTDALVGAGARSLVLGFAGPGRLAGRYIRQALGVLNGLWIDGQDALLTNPETSLDMFRATFVHEFGHFIGLDHSALNTRQALDNDESNDAAIPTMFPQLASSEQATLHLDDRAALSTLYPTTEFLETTGVIRGRVLFPNGAGFQGANVVARNVADPEQMAVSGVSGFLHTGSARGEEFGSDDPGRLGFYELTGLPPGSYTIEITAINPLFRDGSSVGPVDPPAPLPTAPQFFVGPGLPGEVDPDMALPVSAVPGSVVEPIDIIVAGRILSVADTEGRVGTLVQIPLHLTDTSQIRALAFTLRFDAHILSLVEGGAAVLRGPLIPPEFNVTALALGKGRVLVTVLPASSSPGTSLNPGSGLLLSLRFRVSPQSPIGSSSPLKLSNVVAQNAGGGRLGVILQNGSLTVTRF